MIQLIEGETYLIRATTANMSKRAGVPVAAALTISIAATVNSQVILGGTEVYGFAAEEVHTFEFPMNIPIGAGGKSGAITAEVLDPNGNKLADGSLDILIASIGVAEFAYVSNIRFTQIPNPQSVYPWKRAEVDVQNQGSVAEVCTLELYDRAYGWTGFWRAWSLYRQELEYLMSATLEPGETKTFYGVLTYTHYSSTIRDWEAKFIGDPGEIISKVQ